MTHYDPTPDATLDALRASENGCEPALLARKYAAMRHGGFAFMRGTCQLFYAMLPPSAVQALDGAPSAWLSGDLHVDNFGTYRGDNRLTYFGVTDFDEAELAPLTWDLARFLSSIFIGAVDWGLGAEASEALARKALVAYTTELASAKPSWIERDNARGVVKRLFSQIAGRSRSDLLDRMSTRKGKRRRLTIDDRHTLAITEEQRAIVDRVVAAAGHAARDPEYFSVVDIAARAAGVAGLDKPRFVAMVQGRGSPDRNVLLTIRRAGPSALRQLTPQAVDIWRSDAERVAAVQRHCSVVAPALLQSVALDGASYVVRELQPVEDRVRLADWCRHPRKLGDAVVIMAEAAAWMHLRGASWHGSAAVDALAAFAREDGWQSDVLLCAHDASRRTELQFQQFAAAYDRGELDTATLPSP